MDVSPYKPIGVGITMIGALGAGLGLGQIFSSWISGIARNPAAENKMFKVGILGAAMTELALLISFVVAILLMFT